MQDHSAIGKIRRILNLGMRLRPLILTPTMIFITFTSPNHGRLKPMYGEAMAISKSCSQKEYLSLLFKPKHLLSNRILIGVPMTGVISSEWAISRYGQVIPCNWSNSEIIHWMNQCTPLGYGVAEARNVIVDQCVRGNFDWLFFIDHDVILPPDCFIKINNYMLKADIPVVSGLYFAKSHPPEPLVYRGRGNGHFADWKIGQKVWVDGIPMGCTLIHSSILKLMYNDAPPCTVGGNRKVRQVFDSPAGIYSDPEKGSLHGYSGTEDLAWCNRVIGGKYLKKAGWPEIGKKKYPFLIDTSIFCKHITMDGQVYPIGISEQMAKKARNGKPIRTKAKNIRSPK